MLLMRMRNGTRGNAVDYCFGALKYAMTFLWYCPHSEACSVEGGTGRAPSYSRAKPVDLDDSG